MKHNRTPFAASQRAWVVAGASACLVWLCPFCQRASAGDLLARFQQEAPQGWAAWKRQAETTEARVHETRTKRPSGDITQELTHHFYLDRGLLRLDATRRESGGRTVSGVTIRRREQYRFDAERAAAGTYVLKEVDERPSRGRLPWTVCYPFEIESRDCDDLLHDPHFHPLEAVQTTDDDGGELLRVRFDYDADYTQRDGKRNRFEGGWMEFRPEWNWALRRYEVRGQNARGTKFCCRGERAYGPVEEGFIPLRSSLRTSFAADCTTVTGEERAEFDIYRKCRQPDRFFSFEAVGLPDVTRRARIDWGWLLLVNAVVALVVLGLWQRRRQRT